MQTANFRYFSLTLLLLAGTGIYAVLGQPRGNGTPRWPDSEAVYATANWSSGPQSVEHKEYSGNHTDVVTREFRSGQGATASLMLITNQAAKVYSTGPEVGFLGGGYTVLPAPPELASSVGNGIDALSVERGAERWLVMYAYGERRGLLGTGPLAWGLGLLDALLGQPNDYYRMFLLGRIDVPNSHITQDLPQLAHELFPRIAAWYAS